MPSSGGVHAFVTSSHLYVAVDQTTQQLKTALILPKAGGFGAWPVVVSSTFIGHLRRESKGGIYDITIRKLRYFTRSIGNRNSHTYFNRELSHGDFSPGNNQIKINFEHNVPLFVARLDGAHRLVVSTPALT